jgi:dephospho-CoA kinase
VRLGLTGGIGSGKSTVLRMLEELGAGTVDADAIARSVTATGGAAIPAIAERFGAHFIHPQGMLDREKMREHAYADPAARQHLEAIIHPLVGHETMRQAQVHADAGRACVVFDIPLLVETGHWRPRLDAVMVVDCSPATQLERVAARSKLEQAAIERIIAAQAPRALRLAAADLVICNEGISLEELRELVQQAAQILGL